MDISTYCFIHSHIYLFATSLDIVVGTLLYRYVNPVRFTVCLTVQMPVSTLVAHTLPYIRTKWKANVLQELMMPQNVKPTQSMN